MCYLYLFSCILSEIKFRLPLLLVSIVRWLHGAYSTHQFQAQRIKTSVVSRIKVNENIRKSRSMAILRLPIFSILGILLSVSTVVTFHDFETVNAHTHGQANEVLRIQESPYNSLDRVTHIGEIGPKFDGSDGIQILRWLLEGAKLILADETRYAQEWTQMFVNLFARNDRVSW